MGKRFYRLFLVSSQQISKWKI